MREARTKTAAQAREIAVEAMGPDSMSARLIGERMEQLAQRPDDAEPPDPGQGWLGQGPGWGR
jgi:hypothetical protein